MTIPKPLRERFGLGPATEVEFRVVRNVLVLRKKTKKLKLDKWVGFCGRSFSELGYKSVDHYMEDVRGR